MKVIARVDVGKVPLSAAITPDGRYAYTAGQGGVSVVDLARNKLIGTIRFSGKPALIRFSPDGRQAYVAGNTVLQSGLVARVDTTTRAVSADIGVEGGPLDDLAVSADGRSLYTVNTGGGLARIDAQRGRVASRVPLPTGVHHALALSRDGRTAHVASSSPRADADPAKVDVLAIDLARKSVTRKIPVNNGAISRLEMAPDGRRLYASHFPQTQGVPNVISVMDPAAGSVTGTVSVQGRSTGLALAPDGRRIYVLNESGTLQVVDTASGKAIASATVGRETTGMTISPDGRRAYITDAGEEQLLAVAIR